MNVVLHNWKSSIEKAEEYARYIIRSSNESMNESENYLCECNHPKSFGKYCEYLLPIGTTFEETLDWEAAIRIKDV
jgi:hypothetical protein